MPARRCQSGESVRTRNGSIVADIEPLQLADQVILAVGVDLVALQLGMLPGGRQYNHPALGIDLLGH